jgi:DNA-binding NarL/FixJ family response regulator
MKKTAAPTKSTLLIVDDHPMVRERLGELISKEPDIAVCGEADNIRDALTLITAKKPDAIIVDISLQGSSGLELIKDLRATDTKIPVLVLSMHDELVYAERALQAGAQGYITKHAASIDIITAIRQVLAGEVYLAKHVASKILNRLGTRDAANTGISRLTDRELEVFELIGKGRTTSEIAKTLGLSAATVDTYRARIKEKLGLENASQLSAEAGQWLVHSTQTKTQLQQPTLKTL